MFGEIYELFRLFEFNITAEHFCAAVPSIIQLDERLKANLSSNGCKVDQILERATRSTEFTLQQQNLLHALSAEALSVETTVHPFSDQTILAVQTHLNCHPQTIWDAIVDSLDNKVIERELGDLKAKIRIQSCAQILSRLYTDPQSKTSSPMNTVNMQQIVLPQDDKESEPLSTDLFEPISCLECLRTLARSIIIAVPEFFTLGVDYIESKTLVPIGLNLPFDFSMIDHMTDTILFSD